MSTITGRVPLRERLWDLAWDWDNVEHVSGPNVSHLLGETEEGFLLCPSRTRADWWDRPFNPRNPLHWRYWIASRATKRIVFLTPEEDG